MKRTFLKMEMLGALMFLLCIPKTAPADVMTLLKLLTSNLGVTQEQAQGGAGAIFQLVKQNASEKDFASVTEALPGVDSLISSAPKTAELSGKLGGLSSSFSGTSEPLGGIASLAGSFSQLGLQTEMVDKYVKTIIDFAQSEAGEGVANIIKGALL